MPSSLPWRDAALAGVACSMRSMSGPAALAARGHVSGVPGRALLLGAGGELAADKLPLAPDRIKPGPLGGRVASGAYTGHAIAGPLGGLAGAVGAGAGSFATWRIRGLVGEKTGLPDRVIAVAEDVLCYLAAGLATRGVELAQ